jgi:AcrR family transcriptional regulator
VDWWALWNPPAEEESPAPGLRERKKRQMRQLLSDTATTMFLERGFDGVRVAEVAAVCNVSEKTVFNYFPTKEALILDRGESTVEMLRIALARPELTAVEAAITVLDAELGAWAAWLESHDDKATAIADLRRFHALVQETPSLRAYEHDSLDRLTAVVVDNLAVRGRQRPDEPEPQIAARAIVGLWRVQADAMARLAKHGRSTKRTSAAVAAEVRRAAEVVQLGIGRFFDTSRPAFRPS